MYASENKKRNIEGYPNPKRTLWSTLYSRCLHFFLSPPKQLKHFSYSPLILCFLLLFPSLQTHGWHAGAAGVWNQDIVDPRWKYLCYVTFIKQLMTLASIPPYWRGHERNPSIMWEGTKVCSETKFLFSLVVKERQVFTRPNAAGQTTKTSGHQVTPESGDYIISELGPH